MDNFDFFFQNLRTGDNSYNQQQMLILIQRNEASVSMEF